MPGCACRSFRSVARRQAPRAATAGTRSTPAVHRAHVGQHARRGPPRPGGSRRARRRPAPERSRRARARRSPCARQVRVGLAVLPPAPAAHVELQGHEPLHVGREPLLGIVPTGDARVRGARRGEQRERRRDRFEVCSVQPYRSASGSRRPRARPRAPGEGDSSIATVLPLRTRSAGSVTVTVRRRVAREARGRREQRHGARTHRHLLARRVGVGLPLARNGNVAEASSRRAASPPRPRRPTRCATRRSPEGCSSRRPRRSKARGARHRERLRSRRWNGVAVRLVTTVASDASSPATNVRGTARRDRSCHARARDRGADERVRGHAAHGGAPRGEVVRPAQRDRRAPGRVREHGRFSRARRRAEVAAHVALSPLSAPA